MHPRTVTFKGRLNIDGNSEIENEMGGACGAYGGGERGAQGSGGKT